MGVRNGLPEDVTQSTNPSRPTEATEEQRVRQVKHIADPGNDLYSSGAVDTALSGRVQQVVFRKCERRAWVQDENEQRNDCRSCTSCYSVFTFILTAW